MTTKSDLQEAVALMTAWVDGRESGTFDLDLIRAAMSNAASELSIISGLVYVAAGLMLVVSRELDMTEAEVLRDIAQQAEDLDE
jgi:hypothetical protein